MFDSARTESRTRNMPGESARALNSLVKYENEFRVFAAPAVRRPVTVLRANSISRVAAAAVATAFADFRISVSASARPSAGTRREVVSGIIESDFQF